MRTVRAIAWVLGMIVGGAALAADFAMPPTSLPLPLKKHVQRFVDSTQTRNYQCCPVRTYRALQPFKYSSASDSFYTVVGNSYFKYRASDLLTGGRALSRVTRIDVGGELYLAPSGLYDKDEYSAGWPGVQDGQFFLTDFDFDDRGIHYIAYSAFGWGLLNDGFQLQWRLGAATTGQTCTATSCPDNSMIVAVRDGPNYYALVGGPGVWGVWNVNTPTAPTFVRVVNFNGYLTRDSSGTTLAATDISSTVRIIEARDFVQGNTQGKAIGLGGSIVAAAYDGSSFWFLPYSGGSAFYKVSPPLWNATAYPVTGTTIPFFTAQAGADYVIGTDGPTTTKARVYAIRPNGVEEVTSITNYMASYYASASDLQHRALTPFSYNGKTYFLWSMYNVGDVYEVLAGDSLSVTRDTAASPGTPNPNAPPNTTAIPYYGDRQTFKATFAGTTPPTQIKWSPDYPGVAFGAGTALTTPFTHTYSGTVAATKKIRAEDVSRPEVFGETTISLQLPKARVKVPGSTTLAESSQNLGKLLTGASFYDASDGVVEGHLTDWSLDNGTNALAQDPRTPFGVGPCGARTLTFIPRYGAYAPSLSLTYTVQPIIAKAAIDQVASAGTSVVFLNQSTYGSGFQVNPVWTETWELLDGANNVVRSQPSNDVPLGTVTSFSVAKAEIQAGYKVRLRMSISLAVTPAGCELSSQLSDESTILLTTPDPDIVTTACTTPTTLAGSCSLSVRSISSASQSGWTYAWYLDSSTFPSSTAATYSPTFSTVGTHTVTVVATNPFGNGQDTQSFNVITPPCSGAPPQGLISWTSTQTGTRTYTFDARAFSYTFQACDQFSWNFGDGGTASGNSVSHTFAADGTYTVTLVVTNTNGSASFSNTLTVGNVAPPPPPPICADPSNKVYIGWTAASGCAPGLGKPPCKTGESIQFSVDTLPGFSLASCHTYSWQFGDGTGSTTRNPIKSYSTPGSFNVSLTVSNGTVSATTSGTVTVEASTCGTVAPSGLEVFYAGLTSGCQSNNATPCKEGETFRFGILTTGGYELLGCETIGWDFGDGVTSTAKEPTHAFPGVGPYDVLVSVTNTKGSTIAGKTVRFFDPSIPKPVVSIDPVSTKAKVGSEVHFVGNFQSAAELVAINWRVIRTTFGDEVVYTATNTGDIRYTFNELGDYRIELTATNGGGVSTPAVATVTVVEVQEYSFLIPVVAHLKGNNGTQWRTDLQIFNTDPLMGPIEFEFEFRGGAATVTKTITMTNSTQIYEDFLGELSKPFPSLEDAGPVIVLARGDSPPQMWTRTYTVDASGNGSYGQLIPAISLDSALPSEEQAAKYVLPGLEISPRFRTNVGIVNPSMQTVTVNVMARDDSALGVPIGNFDVVVPPLALVQIGDLANRIPDIGDEPFSLNIQPLGSTPVVVYGSMIDMNSNDPVYVSGILDSQQENVDKRVQILPGTGHLEQGNGTWRSDVVVYNPDLLPVRFDLHYYDASGTKVAEAKDQILGNGAFMKVEDVLKWTELDTDPGDSFGVLKVETNDSVSPVGRYPIIFQRTYKDRDELGSFGQGIPAISPGEANVTVDQPAFIAGVRSDESYYTNLGLVAVGDQPSVVRVTLLHDGSGAPVGTWQYVVDGQVAGINPNASLIVTNVIRAISPLANRGTLKIEVVSGGDVWAYASVIAAADPTCNCSKPEQTFDPEYIPAVKMPTP